MGKKSRRKRQEKQSTEACPIPNTHRRLDDAHRLWHQALNAYSDPEGFRTYLNATIETLRNVTWMLQSEKKSIDGFEEWYASRQQTMRTDATLKWVHDARNQVVKQADLQTTSAARAVIHNNITHAILTAADVPPILPTDLVALALRHKLPEPFASKPDTLVMSLERRWCVSELGDRELLDALAHAYGVLSQIVAEAHDRAGSKYEQRGSHDEVVTAPGGRLPCMTTTVEWRTARFRLSDGEPLEVEVVPLPQIPDAIRVAAKRYKLDKVLKPDTPLPWDPFERAEALIPISKKILARDKYHQRMALLRTPAGWHPMVLDARDRAEKYVIMRSLAETVKREQVDAIIEIGEIWISSMAEAEAGRMPEVALDRREALVVSVITSAGIMHRHVTPFTRSIFGKIKFAETRLHDEEVVPYYLAPIFDAWGLELPKMSNSDGDNNAA